MKFAALLLVPILLISAIACDGGDDDPASTSTAAAETPAGATATPPPGAQTPGSTEVPPSVTPDSPGSMDPFSFPADPDPATGIATLVDVRIGEHPEGPGFDRIVFEFDGDRPAGDIEYVQEASQCGSGEPVDLEGNSILRVRFDTAQAHNDQGQQTIDSSEIDGPNGSIAEARQICDFEAVVEWVIGITADKKPFQVFLLDEPARIVIDIEWP